MQVDVGFGDVVHPDAAELEKQWSAFLEKSQMDGPESFLDALAQIGEFLSPVFTSIVNGEAMEERWTSRGPWKDG